MECAFLSSGYDYALHDYGMHGVGNGCQLLRPASIYRCCIGKLGDAGRGVDVMAADAQRRTRCGAVAGERVFCTIALIFGERNAGADADADV